MTEYAEWRQKPLPERLKKIPRGVHPFELIELCDKAAAFIEKQGQEVKSLRDALAPFVEEMDWLTDDELRRLASGELYNNACDEEEAAEQIAARAALKGDVKE